MKVESIEECSPWYILQYFRPPLSDNWSSFWVATQDRFYCMQTGLHLCPLYIGNKIKFSYVEANI